MKDYYDPQTILLNLACAEMLAYYHLPHAGTSGSGLGYGADLAESGLLWMNHLTALLGKVGLAPFVGGVLGSKAFSPTMLVYAHEIIDQAIRFSEGFVLDEDSLALDEIAQRGPGGSFLDSDLTLRLFRKNYYESKLFPRWSLEKWQGLGRPSLDERLRRHTQDLIDAAMRTPPPNAAGLQARGEAWIAKRG
jgi:trimethylamine--corrinoid protein Co-methyltransferase